MGGESAAFNRGKLIDTQISDDLFQPQIPAAAPAGSNCALRSATWSGGKQYGLPSDEDTADGLGVTPVDVSAVLGGPWRHPADGLPGRDAVGGSASSWSRRPTGERSRDLWAG